MFPEFGRILTNGSIAFFWLKLFYVYFCQHNMHYLDFFLLFFVEMLEFLHNMHKIS